MPVAVESAPPSQATPYWAKEPAELLDVLGTTWDGLGAAEATRRLEVAGPNLIHARNEPTRTRVLLKQFRNPLLFILLFAAAASGASQEWLDAIIVSVIVLATIAVGFWREYAAETSAAALQARIRTTTRALRDGQAATIPVEEIVPGDVVLLSAGSLVPADGRILQATDFFVNEAVLTGESFATEKQTRIVSATAALGERVNCVFLGTNVRSGTARCVIAGTGARTEFGRIAGRLAAPPPETDFERGLKRFGYFLMSAMLLLVLGVFLAHLLRSRPPIETLLFSVALAVGLSPELLPAILSMNLARGAEMLARHGVLVRRLNAIESLGSMDVLCTDKTGTLTEGVVNLEGAYDAFGAPSPLVLRTAALNAALETGLDNPLDTAILDAHRPDLAHTEKLAEMPFDFLRKRVSVVVAEGPTCRLITKGAFHEIVGVCSTLSDGTSLDDTVRTQLEARHQRWSGQGIRVLAVASRIVGRETSYARSLESGLSFLGFLAFLDRPKTDARAAVATLGKLGVSIKIISGDNKAVVQHIAGLVGIRTDNILTGADLSRMADEALWRSAELTDLFAEVDPNQKERIIGALRKMGHVVGFLGDGVNDAPAMHVADTSLSVEGAVDVARATADFVLLERNLDVIRRGIEEGRRTFENTMKYVLTTMSANLGNMISMAFASLALPFLPLLPGQILLNNLLSDVPAAGIASDAVDPEQVQHPRRWSLSFIARFMIIFGVVSSVFDFMTFGVLYAWFRATPAQFRTGWFVESLLTELVVALVVRTRRPFLRSRPGALLLNSTLALIAIALAVPYLPLASVLGFVPLPVSMVLAVVTVTALYVLATEVTKHWFYKQPAAR